MSIRVNNLTCGSVIAGLVLLCLWLSFQLIDQSVTLDHQLQQAKLINMQKNLLAKVFNSVNKNIDESSIRKILNEFPTDSVFEKGDGQIVADQVSFFFVDGMLERVDVGEQDFESP